MEFAFCTISEVLTYIGFTPFQFVPVSILTHNVSHKRDSILLALRTVLLWGVLFVFLFRKPIGIHNGLHHNIHIILCQLTAGKQTGYFICELLRLFGTSCAVLLRSLSNEHTIRTEKLIHRNIKCLCQLLRCIQARTRGSAFVSLYGTGGETPETFASCSCVISFFSLSPFNLSLNFIINSLHKISIFSNTTFLFVKRFRRIFKD